MWPIDNIKLYFLWCGDERNLFTHTQDVTVEKTWRPPKTLTKQLHAMVKYSWDICKETENFDVQYVHIWEREGQTVNMCLVKVLGPNVQHLSDTAHAQHYFLQISPQDLCYFTLTTTLEPSTDKPEHKPWQVTLLHIESTSKHKHTHTRTHTNSL